MSAFVAAKGDKTAAIGDTAFCQISLEICYLLS